MAGSYGYRSPPVMGGDRYHSDVILVSMFVGPTHYLHTPLIPLSPMQFFVEGVERSGGGGGERGGGYRIYRPPPSGLGGHAQYREGGPRGVPSL